MKDINDIFDKLNKSLTPSLEQLRELQLTLKHRIQRSIIEDLMNARTIGQVNAVVTRNSEWISEWPELLAYKQSALNRIKGLFVTYIEINGIANLN